MYEVKLVLQKPGYGLQIEIPIKTTGYQRATCQNHGLPLASSPAFKFF